MQIMLKLLLRVCPDPCLCVMLHLYQHGLPISTEWHINWYITCKMIWGNVSGVDMQMDNNLIIGISVYKWYYHGFKILYPPTLHYNSLHGTTLHNMELLCHGYIMSLHDIACHCMAVHSIAWQCISYQMQSSIVYRD